MATYSANTPPPFQADKLADLTSVLQALPDNTSKMISPKDVRDATFTLWENTIYKMTNAGGTEYIGIDQDFIKNKVYFGKKKVNGAFVMSNNLLSTDTDYFFYNTKSDLLSNYDLKIGFLAGTGSNYLGGNLLAPYIYTRVTTQKDLEFEIVNPTSFVAGSVSQGGNIVLQSDHGHVILNGVRWPTSGSNNSSQVDNVLKYKWINGQAYAVWEANSTASVSSVISSGPVVIQGNPVTINGFPIEFSDTNPTPTAFGGIPAGSTFSEEPVVEMIRRMLYPYIRPRLSSTVNHYLIEIGDQSVFANTNMSWELIVNSTYSVSLVPVSFSFNPLFSTLPAQTTITGSGFATLTTGSIRLNTPGSLIPIATTGTTNSWVQETFTVSVQDTFPSLVSTSESILYVLPWFFGTSTTLATQSFQIRTILGTMSSLNPLASTTTNRLTPLLRRPATASVVSNNQIVRMSTHLLNANNTGYIYFGYPSSFPDLIDIYHGTFSVMGSFQKFLVNGLSSNHTPPRWQNKNYKFYIYCGPTLTTPQVTQINAAPPYYSDFEFRFA